ncbi:MAG TPA: hypothetical protein VIT92_05810, partial [Burkholderiaceae bacterium]
APTAAIGVSSPVGIAPAVDTPVVAPTVGQTGQTGTTGTSPDGDTQANTPTLFGRTVYGNDLVNTQNASVGEILTDVKIESTASAAQTNAAVTFGQVFAPGQLAAGESVVGKLDNGTLIPLQLDVKATHADKSVRHAVFSALIPSLAAGQSMTMFIAKSDAAQTQLTYTAAQLAAAGFSAKVTLMVNGQQYTAAAEDVLKSTTPAKWLSGRIANEWMVSAPLRDASGTAHPHLTARFDVRAYYGLNKAKVDVVVENNWAYEAAPSNITYDAVIAVGGQPVYTKPGLTHFHHARWKKSFWWGTAPQVHIKHNTTTLIASRAIPNYDRSAIPSAATVANLRLNFTGEATEPMGNGIASSYMPGTGGRMDLGILPGWAVTYLLSQDKDAKNTMLGTADLGGSWSAHYRDKKTDRVVSLLDYPYMTLLGREGDTYNPVTRKSEAFPACGGTCSNKHEADSSHQPNFAYLPYIITGDHYYLEEMQFWAMWNMFQHNPGYRDNIKGLVKPDQIRGQAWSMRTLGEVAYITPDSDALKSHFETFLSNNLDWYNTAYSNNASANNTLGAITDGNALVYDGGVGIAPWQDDFFTMSIGHLAELGYAKAKPLLAWKAKFPVQRMVAPGFCWIEGAMYKMKVRDSANGANYTSMAQVYAANQTSAITSLACGSSLMATALGMKVGEMTGFSDAIDGYPSYMQAALSYAAAAGNADAAKAWTQFNQRSIKADYSRGAQFALLPR